MKTRIILITAIALMALSFSSPVMASDSIQSSTEKGVMHPDVRGYFGADEATMPQPDVAQSIRQSREDGGM